LSKTLLAQLRERSSPIAYKVYAADFCDNKGRYGLVHTAVCNGQETLSLVPKSVAKSPSGDPGGRVHKSTGWLEGRSVIDPELAVDILIDLQKNETFCQGEPLALVPLLLEM